MSKIIVHAGDFQKCKASIMFGIITFPWESGDGFSGGKKISIKELEEISPANEESVKRLGGTIGWGVVGATLLGPVGLLAGLIAGGRGKNVTFVAKFKDGRKMLATTDSKTFTKMQAIVF